MLGWLACRYGRRGAWLIVLGVVWVSFGLGLLLQPQAPRPWVLNEYLPAWVNALGWGVSGGVAIWQGLLGRGRDDSLGHLALYVMPAVRMTCFGLAWVLWLISLPFEPTHQMGWPAGWFAAVVWFLVIIMLRLVSDWPNPVSFPPPPDGASRRS